VTLDKVLTWSKNFNHVRKKAAQRLGTLVLLLNRKSGLSIRNGVLLYKQLIHPMMELHFPFGGPPLAPTSRNCKSCSPSVVALLSLHNGTLVTGKFTIIWGAPISPTTSDP
jgi:hypothetical protein